MSVSKAQIVSVPPAHREPGTGSHLALEMTGDGGARSRGAIPLPSDARAKLVLLNEVRYRAVAGVFGVRRDQVNLMTGIATLMLAQAASSKARQLPRARRGHRRGDVILADGLLNALGQEVAGRFSREMPFFAAIIGTAAVGAIGARVLRESRRDLKAASHRVTGFLAELYRDTPLTGARDGGYPGSVNQPA